jgi:hypothetical protein
MHALLTPQHSTTQYTHNAERTIHTIYPTTTSLLSLVCCHSPISTQTMFGARCAITQVKRTSTHMAQTQTTHEKKLRCMQRNAQQQISAYCTSLTSHSTAHSFQLTTARACPSRVGCAHGVAPITRSPAQQALPTRQLSCRPELKVPLPREGETALDTEVAEQGNTHITDGCRSNNYHPHKATRFTVVLKQPHIGRRTVHSVNV